ncbi:interferon-inducible GTPase 5-like [Mercenaria mercenaria]|uniref:interferon-inducible GTPase 5-like n=1 Tax=Mercenaria mercenaria TaxID=6596 RepID=UPI00234E8504|nr:interferon-inducible GTPase 5-like [Mercenaria mercenaria]
MTEEHFTLSEAEKAELLNAVTSGGVPGLIKHIQTKNCEWKKIPLNIAITGASGVGKSSFINAIRGLTADDEGGAHVDVVEATKDVKPYTHPENENMVFWDLPGVGTPKFPREKYLKIVNFDSFDFFLILAAGRFRNNDLWLAKEITERKKIFHFVRTQLDVEVSNDKKGHPKSHKKDNVIEKVRADCRNILDENGFSEMSVFLIDSYCPFDFDFNSLTTTLIDETLDRKREAMVLSMSLITDGVLERKVEALEKRIIKVSVASAVGGAIPIPGISGVVDLSLLISEYQFYKKQLGIDKETIEEDARPLDKDPKDLIKELGLQSGKIKTVYDLLPASHTFLDVVQSTLPLILPILGSCIAAGMSYSFAAASLRGLLQLCADDARKMHKELVMNALN